MGFEKDCFKKKFSGEKPLMDEYMRLQSIDPTNKALSDGRIEDGHFYFTSGSSPTPGKVLEYISRLCQEIRSLGKKTVAQENEEKRKKLIGKYRDAKNRIDYFT
jgi:hypothetical protein